MPACRARRPPLQAVDLRQPAACPGGRRRVTNQRATCEKFPNPGKTCSGPQSGSHPDHIDAGSPEECQRQQQDGELAVIARERMLGECRAYNEGGREADRRQPGRVRKEPALVEREIDDRRGRQGDQHDQASRLKNRGSRSAFRLRTGPAQGRWRCPTLSCRGLKLAAQLLEPPGDPLLDRAVALAEYSGDFAKLQIGAEAQRDRLTLVIAQCEQSPAELITVVHGSQSPVMRRTGLVSADPLKRSGLDALPPSLIADQVHGDRVDPVPLASPPRIKPRPSAQYPLEGVCDQVLG